MCAWDIPFRKVVVRCLLLFSLFYFSVTQAAAQHATELHVTPFLKLPSEGTKAYGFAKTMSPSWESTDSLWIRNVLDQSQWNKIRVTKILDRNGLIVWLDSNITDTLSNSFERWLESAFQSYWNGPLPNAAFEPQLGIKQLLSELIGDFPNINADNTVHVVVTDIQDGYPEANQFVVGFFDPINLLEHPFSNRRDMIYLDIYPGLVQDDEINEQRFFSTFAHELQHLAFANYDREFEDLVFINEGMSEVFEIACGFPPRSEFGLRRNLNRSLWSWNYADAIPDYERASSFFHFLVEQKDWEIMQNIIHRPQKGIDGLISSYPGGHSAMTNDYRKWAVSLVASTSPSANAYSFRHPDRLKADPIGIPTMEYNQTIRSFGSSEWTFSVLQVVGKGEIEFSTQTNSALDVEFLNSTIRNPYSYSLTKGKRQQNGEDTPTTNVVFAFGNSTDSASTQENVFISTSPSWKDTQVLAGDGIADVFTGNARYMSYRNGLQSMGWILRGNYSMPPHKFGINAVWENELEITPVDRTLPRETHIHISTFSLGQKSVVFDSTMILPTRAGRFGMEFLELPYVESWPITTDSVMLEISQSTGPNTFALGLEKSAQDNLGFLFYETDDGYRYFGANNHLNLDLSEFAPSLAFQFYKKESAPIFSQFLIDNLAFQDTAVVIALNQDYLLRSLSVQLPNGTWFSPTIKDTARYAVPAQIGAEYMFVVEATDTTKGETWIQQATWKLPKVDPVRFLSLYPNPVSTRCFIDLYSISSEDVEVDLYDILGRKIFGFGRFALNAGKNTLSLDLQQIAHGVYVLSVNNASKTHRLTRKMMIIH